METLQCALKLLLLNIYCSMLLTGNFTVSNLMSLYEQSQPILIVDLLTLKF